MTAGTFPTLFAQAQERRRVLITRLKADSTNAYRLFHGISEGLPGLNIDRYGTLILAQTFRDPLPPAERDAIENHLRETLPFTHEFTYNHRGKTARETFDLWHEPRPEALEETQCREFGTEYLIRARHPGIDPWLFLDLRAGRRYVREHAKGRSVLNLFSYTCSVGITAAAAGASEVWNVDFAASNLEVGRRNATLNQLPEARFRTLQEDCIPVLRQLAGLPVGGRFGQKRSYLRHEPRSFDVVVLDPPGWAKSPFGAIDVAGDYASLFKPAVLIARAGGGKVIATNHLATVSLEAWIEGLERCAAKAGRPLKSVQTLTPEEDFPSFDGKPPLKIAVCEV